MAKKQQEQALPEILARAGRVRLLLLDVDGVLTDGGLDYGPGDGVESRRFDVKDGAGIYLAVKHGFEVGILTGKRSRAVEMRASDLGISRVVQGSRDKRKGLEEALADGKYAPEEVAYVGDDIIDLPVFAKVGFTACPSDAHSLVKARVDYVCSLPGGHGAVREVIDLILTSRGDMDAVLREFEEE